jgi:D-3-phosphoglycerate dehydrogenase / 2-oxoglutarate reductase
LSEKIKILIADKIDLTHLKILNTKYFDITCRIGMSDSDLLNYSYLNNFKVLLVKSRRNIDKTFLSRCVYETIGTASKGTDHIDVDYAKKRNILILNSESGNTLSAAEHTFALILDAVKKTHYSDKLVRHGKFSFWNYNRQTLSGKKIGIIGTGKVGIKVAHFAKAFDMEIIANDIDPDVRRKNKHLKYYDLKYLLRNSDIVTVHIPMSESNKMFINKESIDIMQNNVIFINTSRGGVVDEKNLIKKLKSEKKFFAALDVFNNEPDINKDFIKLKNVILTNHVAGKTLEGEQNIGNELFMQVKNTYRNNVN